MSATQKDIAEKLGISRTTVSKILTRDPKYYASEETRKKVFDAAQDLGYDFAAIRRPYSREHPRLEVNAPCEISITLDNGEIFDNGRGVVVNMSAGGLLITSLRTERMVLPLQGFKMMVRLSGLDGFSDLIGQCEIVRMTHSAGGPEVGVRLVGTSPEDRRRITDLVQSELGLPGTGG